MAPAAASAVPLPVRSAAQLADQLDALASAIESADPVAASPLASSIPATETVITGAETFEVRLDWLATALRAPDADAKDWDVRKRDLLIRLRAMTREVRADRPPTTSASDGRTTLGRVMADRGFARARSDPWQARLWDRLSRWFTDLWARGLGRRIRPQTVAVVFAWTASIAAIVVLLIWLTRVAFRRRSDRPLALGPVDARRTAGRELALEAAALVRAGRVREAARVAYRASVHRLEEEGAFRVDETRTPREYLRLLPASHRRRATLAALTTTFERIWYGSRAAAPDEGDRILALLQDLECLSREHAN